MALLETRGVSVNFGGLIAVRDLDMSVDEGEIVGLIGPNGAGKTTTFQVLSGYQLPSKGRVFFGGKDITGLVPYEIAALGLVRTFQRSSVFSDITVLENLIAAAHLHVRSSWWEAVLSTRRFKNLEGAAREWASEVLGFVGLWDKRGQLARHLSYGERRLLEMGIGLAAKPRLLLLDEPASGMNPEEAQQVMRLIAAIRDRGVTVLLVEHHMDVIMGICDRIVVLNYGVKIAEGTPEQIQNDPEVIAAYLGGEAVNA